MKRLVVGFGVAFWIAFASLGSVAAQGGSGGEDRHESHSFHWGVTQASARTSGPEASGKITFTDILISKKQPPGGEEN